MASGNANTQRPPRRSIGARLRRMLFQIVVLVMIAYLTISTVAATMLTVPRRRGVTQTEGTWTYAANPKSAIGVDYQEVAFPARRDKTNITGWYMPVVGSERVLIFVHGKDRSRTSEFQGTALSFLKAMHDRGFSILTIDMRGHGASGAARSTFGLHERRDILGAVDWLLAQGFQPGRIGVLGASMGAASSIGAAAEEPAIGALVADSSYASIYPIMQNVLGRQARVLNVFLPSSLFMGRFVLGANIADARPVTEIARIAPRPVLLIHGTRDWLIPPADAEQLHAAAPHSELWMVPGAGHTRVYSYNPQAYIDRVAEFFETGLQ